MVPEDHRIGTQPASVGVLRKTLRATVVHARRDIRRTLYQLRHNGALLTFILVLAVFMCFAGSYLARHPLLTQTMDARAGCDVNAQLHRSVAAICAK